MRHLGSLLLSLVLAPAVWVLAGYGMNEVSVGVGRFDLRMVGGYAALAAAGVLLTLLVLTRLSPVGPATAGLAFIVVSVWAGQDPGLFRGLFTASVFGRPAGLVNPIVAIGPVVGTLLLLTVTSPRRWRRHPAPAAPQPIYPGATVGPPAGYPQSYPTSPAFAAAPGSPAGPYSTGVLYGQGYGSPAPSSGIPAPTSAAPASGPPSPVPTPPGPVPTPPGPVPTPPGPVPNPPMAQSGPPPAGPAHSPPPTAGPGSVGAWSTPPPRPPGSERTPPPPPPRFTPHVPRQPGASEAADATDLTTRLGPNAGAGSGADATDLTTRLGPNAGAGSGAADETTRLSPPPDTDETTRLTRRPDPADDETTPLGPDDDEQTTLLRPPAAGDDAPVRPDPGSDEQTTVLKRPAAGDPGPDRDEAAAGTGEENGDETTVLGGDRAAEDGRTRPLHGTPPPPAAYPPPGHATPTAPPTDPDATRRL